MGFTVATFLFSIVGSSSESHIALDGGNGQLTPFNPGNALRLPLSSIILTLQIQLGYFVEFGFVAYFSGLNSGYAFLLDIITTEVRLPSQGIRSAAHDVSVSHY